MDVQLETERLLLRPITHADIPDLFELDADPAVHRYLGNQPVTAIEEIVARLADIHQQYEKNGIGRLAIVEKKSGEFVGWSGLKYETEVRKEFNYYDLGYRLKQGWWGKGIATEAAIASLTYGFTDLELAEICAGAHVDNQGSNRILRQKLGMSLIETFTYDGEPHNWYRLRRSDWQA
jgi:ribosomal-protein-alanine N-acetyltransferase